MRSNSIKSTFGFTLIELLIVMSISAMAVALVGGLTMDTAKKFNQKAEQLELKSFLRQSSHLAFLHEKPLEVQAAENKIVLMDQRRQVSVTEFSHLRFPTSKFSLNAAGTYSRHDFKYFANERALQLDLSDL